MARRIRITTALVLAALLSACGGGDDGSPTGPGFQPPTGVAFNPFEAWANLLLTARTWQVSGVGSDQFLYTITIATTGAVGGGSLLPITGFPVPGFTAAVSDTTISTAVGGTVTNVFRRTFFDPATLQILGFASQVDGGFATCDVALASSVPPAVAAIGDSGPLAVLDERGDCAIGSPSIGRLEITWSLEFDQTTGASLFCVHSAERNVSGLVVSQESDCIEVAPDGSLGDRALVTLQTDGFLLVAD
jgi:hypothetical protein